MNDLSWLFQTDPLGLTRPNIEELISAYRQARANFNLGDITAGNRKKLQPGPKVEKIDLEDIL